MSSTVTYHGSKITANGRTVTVLNQHRLSGTYKGVLSTNGCGACCASFALALQGKKVTPSAILKAGVKKWGKWPRAASISAQGLATLIKGYGVPASYVSVSKSNRAIVKITIGAALKSGRQVICWTAPNGHAGDPFSTGDHYVLAVGYAPDGKIIVANSGNRGPVNRVSLDTLCKYLQEGNGKDKGWWRTVAASAGVVIVGKTQAAKKSAPHDLETLKRGMTGTQVKALQKLLGGLPIGGAFGAKTEAAVKAYQKMHKLTADGVVGPKTWDSLLK